MNGPEGASEAGPGSDPGAIERNCERPGGMSQRGASEHSTRAQRRELRRMRITYQSMSATAAKSVSAAETC